MPRNEVSRVAQRNPRLIDVFRARSEAQAILVANHHMTLHEAVDGLWSAAERYGLVDLMGADYVQGVLAIAFDNSRGAR